MTHPLARISLLAFAAACLFGLSACQPQDGDDDAATNEPLVFVFQKQKDPEAIREKADQLAAELAEHLGRDVEPFVPQDYAASVQALVSQQADFAYVSSIPFLLARRDGDAVALLAEVRADPSGQKRTTYDSVFVVPADSDIQDMADIVEQAGDLRMCFTSRTSTSGYVMAYSRLVDEGVLEAGQDPEAAFASVSFGGSYTDALQQVLDGNADLTAVSYYTLEGPRADVYTTPQQREQLRIVARTPDVPTHLICARGGIDPETREAVQQALLKISEQNPDLLGEVYGATELTPIDGDEHVRPAATAIERLGIGLDPFDKRSKASGSYSPGG